MTLAACGSWWFRLIVISVITVASQLFLQPGLYFTGDEPHYMMSVLSFVTDHDFNGANNYARGDYKLLAIPTLSPQWVGTGRPGLIPAEHGTLFPLLLAPSYALRNMAGVRDFLVLCSLLACLTTAGILDLLTPSRLAGTAGALLVAIAPTWQMQASRVYPEVVGSLLLMISLFLLARHVTKPATPSLEAGILGFCTLFVLILYTKYIAFTAALALTIAFLPRLRFRPALWAGGGAAVAVALVNLALWANEGAFWPGFPAGQSLFSVAGWSTRYWKQWFDQYHGLFVFQPYTLLSLWAMIWLLKPSKDERTIFLMGLASTVLLFTGMHSVWTPGPGHCVPGRFLSAVLPVMGVLIVLWCGQTDRFRWVRIAAVLAGVAVVITFVIQAVKWGAPPYFVLRPWIESFDRYWGSWEPGSLEQVKQVGLIGYGTALTILLTKLVARKA